MRPGKGVEQWRTWHYFSPPLKASTSQWTNLWNLVGKSLCRWACWVAHRAFILSIGHPPSFPHSFLCVQLLCPSLGTAVSWGLAHHNPQPSGLQRALRQEERWCSWNMRELGIKRPEFLSQPCPYFTLWPWASHFHSMGLHILSHQMRRKDI